MSFIEREKMNIGWRRYAYWVWKDLHGYYLQIENKNSTSQDSSLEQFIVSTLCKRSHGVESFWQPQPQI